MQQSSFLFREGSQWRQQPDWLRRQARPARKIIDESSWTFGRWAFFAVIVLGTAVAGIACGFALGLMFPPRADEIQHLRSLFPQGTEKMLWVMLCLSAGFCEEFLYRGYLQQQFHRLTVACLRELFCKR